MKKSVKEKLDLLQERYSKISSLLSSAEVTSDQNRFRDLSKEFSQLEPVVQSYEAFLENQKNVSSAQEMLETDDEEMKLLAKEEVFSLLKKQEDLEEEIKILLLPQDENDKRNVFLEIRSAAGGDESAIFSGDLFRMYASFAESNKWQIEILRESLGDHGGYKELILRISGSNVYSKLKFESGAHRVQRVPETESQGRIHTSTSTVAVFPEAEKIDDIDINPSQLRIDTFRSQGAGGQHVNTTDSAVRITHIPSGIVVECQDERSQHKNKAKAMSLLQAKLLNSEKEKQRAQQDQTRRDLVGTGDRSERIRTYNFPQGRITDHRINLTLYKLEQVMQGDLSEIIDNLVREHQADLLSKIEN